MNVVAELELTLRRRDATRFAVDMSFLQPGSEADVSPLGQQVVIVSFDHERLRELTNDPDDYGRELGRMLFQSPALATAFAECRAAAQSQKGSLRLRLALSADAPELHTIFWETLRDPKDDLALARSERIIFTRTLASADWQPVTLRAKGDLSALAVVAAPNGLEQYKLAPIRVLDEQARILTGLHDIPTTVLATPGQASLATISGQLREGYDILYLVAHGAMVDGEPWLFLDDGAGATARVPGEMLVERLVDLPLRPRLIVLASCNSAGDRSRGALTALGPRLAMAGIPAVIAMQGELSMDTNGMLMPAFFRELRHDGSIDRALAVARQAVLDRPDWWAPVLFTRLRSGRIWYEPGFADEDFKKWPTLLESIASGRCTPILGPGLLDRFIGSTRDLARRLAVEHRFPLAPFARDDLPQVAQYLTVNQDDNYLRTRLSRIFHVTLESRTGSKLPASGTDADLAALGAQRRAVDVLEPHRVLAGLPLPVYLSASPDRLLIDALTEAGKAPQVLICPWNRHGELTQSPVVPPTKDTPLVYHLFGRLDDPESLVLTEDDYFRYLIGVTRNEDLLPKVVGSALVNTALLFVGFRLDDWNFRVLFQSLMNLQGARLRRRYTHVAVQIDPQEGTMLDPKAAREYLKTYFGQMASLNYQTNITIYWGSAEDFIRELAQQYAKHAGTP